jgi:N-acetylmuramoyl-L-alanine amidase
MDSCLNTRKMKRLKLLITLLFLMPFHTSIAQHKKVIIIDAGHGGIDSGAIGTNHIQEKDITLAIAKAILIFNSKVFNTKYDLYLTRYTDTLISLSHRTKLVKALRPDLFISLHCNHAKNEKATGVEIYLHSKTSSKTKNQVESMRLGQSIVGTLTQKLGYRSRGLKRANFQVLRESIAVCPAILVELGFLSNHDEAAYLEMENNSRALALAVLMSIKM